jgi:hypothetical protein
MARIRILSAAALAVAALAASAVLAAPAGASVPRANPKFCAAAAKIGNDAQNVSGFSKTKAKQLQSQFKTAAKNAPANVKKAVTTITKVLGLITGATNASDLPKVYASDAFKQYPNAISTFFTYQATQCSGT